MKTMMSERVCRPITLRLLFQHFCSGPTKWGQTPYISAALSGVGVSDSSQRLRRGVPRECLVREQVFSRRWNMGSDPLRFCSGTFVWFLGSSAPSVTARFRRARHGRLLLPVQLDTRAAEPGSVEQVGLRRADSVTRSGGPRSDRFARPGAPGRRPPGTP